MNKQNNVFLKSVVVLVILIPIVLLGLTAGRTPVIEPWPSFDMVYQEYRHPNGYSEDSDIATLSEFDTWNLAFTNLRNWKLTLIDSTYKPEAIGEWSSFDGQAYHSYSPILRMTDKIPNREIVVPNDWLSPGIMDRLPDHDYIVAEQTAKQSRYVLTVPDFVCTEGPPICPDKKANYVYVSEFVFNEYGIPIEVIDKLDNIISRHIVVTELSIYEASK